MNTDALVKRYGKIPPAIHQAATRVWDHLSQQADHVVSVEFMENFNKDHDMSLRHNTDIYKGMVVTVRPQYALGEEDILWMHPQAYQCRAVFEGGGFDTVALPDMNASYGNYCASTIDEIGCQHDTKYTIINTRMPFVRTAATPADAYDNATKHETLDHCQEIANKLGCGEMVEHTFTNLFLKGSNEYAFFNHAFMNRGVVHVSPLMGYRTVTASGNFAADRMHENQYVNVDGLSREQKEQLFQKVQWGGNSPINTYVFRKPFDNMTNVGTHFRLVRAHFAETPIHEKMSIRDLYRLTPNLSDCDVVGVNTDERIALPVTAGIVQQLMELEGFSILNREYLNDGKLMIPRNVVHQLI